MIELRWATAPCHRDADRSTPLPATLLPLLELLNPTFTLLSSNSRHDCLVFCLISDGGLSTSEQMHEEDTIRGRCEPFGTSQDRLLNQKSRENV